MALRFMKTNCGRIFLIIPGGVNIPGLPQQQSQPSSTTTTTTTPLTNQTIQINDKTSDSTNANKKKCNQTTNSKSNKKAKQDSSSNPKEDQIQDDGYYLTDGENLRCGNCQKIFPTLATFSKHLARYLGFESKQPMYHCRICNNFFMKRKTMFRHLHMKHSEKLLKSPYRFSSIIYRCNQCPWEYINDDDGQALANHMFIQHGQVSNNNDDKKRKQVRCTNCQKLFSMVSLGHHLAETDCGLDRSRSRFWNCPYEQCQTDPSTKDLNPYRYRFHMIFTHIDQDFKQMEKDGDQRSEQEEVVIIEKQDQNPNNQPLMPAPMALQPQTQTQPVQVFLVQTDSQQQTSLQLPNGVAFGMEFSPMPKQKKPKFKTMEIVGYSDNFNDDCEEENDANEKEVVEELPENNTINVDKFDCECYHCHKKFTSLRELCKHIRREYIRVGVDREHKERFKCQLCNRWFAAKISFLRHMFHTEHHFIPDIYGTDSMVYCCGKCSWEKRGNNARFLMYHWEKVHQNSSKRKRLFCFGCKKRFYLVPSLYEHVIITDCCLNKEKTKFLYCPFGRRCSMSFAPLTPYRLKLHILTYHVLNGKKKRKQEKNKKPEKEQQQQEKTNEKQSTEQLKTEVNQK